MLTGNGAVPVYRFLAALPVLLLLTTCACAESGTGGFGGGTQGCEFRPDQPHISAGHLERTGVKRIVGKVVAQCRVRVDSHSLDVWLETDQDGGGWAARTWPITDLRIPRTGRNRVTVQAVYRGCVTGWWRTAAKATSVYMATSGDTHLAVDTRIGRRSVCAGARIVTARVGGLRGRGVVR